MTSTQHNQHNTQKNNTADTSKEQIPAQKTPTKSALDEAMAENDSLQTQELIGGMFQS